jgi:hypothetical protein
MFAFLSWTFNFKSNTFSPQFPLFFRSLSGQFEDAMAKDAAKEKAEEDAAAAAAVAASETPPPAAAPAN